MDPLEQSKEIETKRELARRLIEGDGMEKHETKAVELLEECVNQGDAIAMLTLAKCCTLGYGMEQNVERAESLILKAAMKGNKEAQSLIGLIHDWKGRRKVDLSGLFTICIEQCFLKGCF